MRVIDKRRIGAFIYENIAVFLVVDFFMRDKDKSIRERIYGR